MTREVATLSQLPLSAPAFDYGSMSAPEVAALRSQADKIRRLSRSSMATIIELGRELVDAKKRLPHGQFERWVEAECGFTRRTANNYMTAASFADDKPETVSDLSPSLVYQLASKSTPVEIVDEILDRARKGEVIDQREVECRLREASRQQRAEAKKEKKRKSREISAKTRKRRAAEEEKHKAVRREREQRHQEAAKAILDKFGIDGVRFLIKELGEAHWNVLDLLKSKVSEAGSQQGKCHSDGPN